MSPPPGCIPPIPKRCCRPWSSSRRGGNSVFVVEHDLEVMRRAQWIVDVGPDAGANGGQVLYSGPLEGLRSGRGIPYFALFIRRHAASASPAPNPAWLARIERSHAATIYMDSMFRFP